MNINKLKVGFHNKQNIIMLLFFSRISFMKFYKNFTESFKTIK